MFKVTIIYHDDTTHEVGVFPCYNEALKAAKVLSRMHSPMYKEVMITAPLPEEEQPDGIHKG